MMFMFTIGEILNSLGQAPFVSRRIPASHRGRINSYIGIGYMLGSFVGQLVIGIMIDYTSFDMAFIVMAIGGLIATAVVIGNYTVDRHRFPKLYAAKASEISNYN